MQAEAPDFSIILEVLTRYQVDFIVVGGVCAVLLGAPVSTFDLDIVHSRNKNNLQRLNNALEEIEAHYREHLPKKLPPRINNLDTKGHHLLITKYGPLDILGTIGDGDDYQALELHTETINLSNETTFKILDLDTLIKIKTITARAKDKPMLAILEAMRNEFTQ